MKFRIDPSLLENASEMREREWQMALVDLNADADGEEPTLTVHRRKDGGADIHVTHSTTADGIAELGRDKMRRQFRDYRHVIEQISGAGVFGARQFETLDYAKKLVHDEAGEVIAEALQPFTDIDHKTARRLFTLVFLIGSELPEAMVTRHRR